MVEGQPVAKRGAKRLVLGAQRAQLDAPLVADDGGLVQSLLGDGASFALELQLMLGRPQRRAGLGVTQLEVDTDLALSGEGFLEIVQISSRAFSSARKLASSFSLTSASRR